MKKRTYIVTAIPLLIIIIALLLWMIFENHEPVEGSKQLPEFNSIEIDVKAADITLVEGDEFKIDYSLHSRETIKELEVSEQTLIFKTGIDFSFKPEFKDWYVTITIPQDKVLENIDINVTSGEINLVNRAFSSGNLKTTAGDIKINEITCNDLTLETVADYINIQKSNIAESLDCKSVAGEITIDTNVNTSINAESIGGITYGTEQQGHKFALKLNQPQINAKSVSGHITFNINE